MKKSRILSVSLLLCLLLWGGQTMAQCYQPTMNAARQEERGGNYQRAAQLYREAQNCYEATAQQKTAAKKKEVECRQRVQAAEQHQRDEEARKAEAERQAAEAARQAEIRRQQQKEEELSRREAQLRKREEELRQQEQAAAEHKREEQYTVVIEPTHEEMNSLLEEEEVFSVVDEDPEFPGGLQGLSDYIKYGLKYPQQAVENRITGRVFITFVVNSDGSVSNVKILRDIGGGCGEEAVRLVKAMPRWKPGRHNGKAVRTQFNIPVNFELE